MITGVIATVFGILGVIGIFTGNIPFVFAGGMAEILQTLFGFFISARHDFLTVVIAAVAGAVVALVAGVSVLYGAMAGLCFEGAIMGSWSIYDTIHSLAHRNDHRNVYRKNRKNDQRNAQRNTKRKK